MKKRLTTKIEDNMYACGFDKEDLNSKLGPLEDWEEKFGIDLITLFKAYNGMYYIKNGEIKFSCHISIFDYGILVLEEHILNKEMFALNPKDYGKTWALTREELE